MSLEDDLGDIARRTRVYAPLREGGTKGQKELGVLQDFLQSTERAGGLAAFERTVEASP